MSKDYQKQKQNQKKEREKEKNIHLKQQGRQILKNGKGGVQRHDKELTPSQVNN